MKRKLTLEQLTDAQNFHRFCMHANSGAICALKDVIESLNAVIVEYRSLNKNSLKAHKQIQKEIKALKKKK